MAFDLVTDTNPGTASWGTAPSGYIVRSVVFGGTEDLTVYPPQYVSPLQLSAPAPNAYVVTSSGTIKLPVASQAYENKTFLFRATGLVFHYQYTIAPTAPDTFIIDKFGDEVLSVSNDGSRYRNANAIVIGCADRGPNVTPRYAWIVLNYQ